MTIEVLGKMITPEQLAKSGTEYGAQAALFCWASSSGIPELKWLFSIPNGGFRDKITAGKLKASGVKAGVVDIMLPVSRWQGDPGGNEYKVCGLFIEMKTGTLKPTIEQKEFLAFVEKQGYVGIVCYSWQQARDVILKYLGKI